MNSSVNKKNDTISLSILAGAICIITILISMAILNNSHNTPGSPSGAVSRDDLERKIDSLQDDIDSLQGEISDLQTELESTNRSVEENSANINYIMDDIGY
ncbi:MAG: hypothetical protein EOM35_03850 [Negativicutes bacterium]|nr:hypothetical protein [Negativicutes bacterium]